MILVAVLLAEQNVSSTGGCPSGNFDGSRVQSGHGLLVVILGNGEQESFHIRGCGERGPAMATDDWPELPAWTEKRAHIDMFDPEGVLFRGGAHMPLFGFLGNRPRRSDAAIVRREQRFCERKGKTSLKGKGRQGSGGKSSWGEARGGKGKGKPRVAMEAWANRDATADAPSTVVETWSGWGALAEGKGHAENAPWTTYSQSTNDGHRWGGDWRGTQPMALLLVAQTQLPQEPPSMATSSNGQPWWRV